MAGGSAASATPGTPDALYGLGMAQADSVVPQAVVQHLQWSSPVVRLSTEPASPTHPRTGHPPLQVDTLRMQCSGRALLGSHRSRTWPVSAR